MCWEMFNNGLSRKKVAVVSFWSIWSSQCDVTVMSPNSWKVEIRPYKSVQLAGSRTPLTLHCMCKLNHFKVNTVPSSLRPPTGVPATQRPPYPTPSLITIPGFSQSNRPPDLRHHHFFVLRLYLCIFREIGREGEKQQYVVAPHTPPSGDLANNPGMCPDWESNRQPFIHTPALNHWATPARAVFYSFNTNTCLSKTESWVCLFLFFFFLLHLNKFNFLLHIQKIALITSGHLEKFSQTEHMSLTITQVQKQNTLSLHSEQGNVAPMSERRNMAELVALW